MVGLFALLAAIYRIGRLALPSGGMPGARPALAGCLGTALLLINLSLTLGWWPLERALPAALVLALAAACALRRTAGPLPAAALPAAGYLGMWTSPELILTAWVALIAFRGYFYDELDHHLPITNEILRGLYPPPYPFLPSAPFRYYLGYNILSAAIAKVSSLPVWYAFDVVTVLAAAALVRLCGAMAATSAIRGAARITMWLTVLSGGLAWILFPMAVQRLPHPDVPTIFAMPFSHLEYEPWQLPPMAGYLFQHPMSLGLPLWLAALMMWLSPGESPHRTLVAGVLLGGVGFSQPLLLYFAAPVLFLGALLRGVLFTPVHRSRSVLEAFAAVALGLAVYVGIAMTSGVVAPSAQTLAFRFPPHLGWEPGVSFPGYLVSFGLPPLLALWGVVISARRRWEPGLLLALAGLCGFVIPHVVEIRQNPWDTTKFFVPFMLACSTLAAIALADLRSRSGCFGGLLLALVTAACCLSPVLFLGVRAVGPLYVDSAYAPIPSVLLPPPQGGVDRQAGEWLGHVAAPADVALTLSLYVVTYSGVPAMNPQENVWAWFRALDPDGTAKRDIDRLWADLDAGLLAKYKIRWLVIGPAERRRLGTLAGAGLTDGRRFVVRTRIGPPAEERVIYEVLPISTRR